uniref:Regulatory protein zeste n=1 Tax=Meloidogyne javanica TaxID=6303 RepID=A0A915M151_MELJA
MVKEEKSSTSGHHEGQSDRKSILNDFIEKARGVWLQEASINILENLGPNNEVTMLKTRKMKEKYLSKGLFSTETAKQKAELLGAEFISLFDIQFGDIDVKAENQIDLNDFDFDFSDTSNIDFNLLQDLI